MMKLSVLGDLAGDHDGDHRRHEGQGEDEGRYEGDDDGQRHRLEHLALDPGEGQEWHVDEDDDGLPVEGGLDHLLGRGPHCDEALLQVELAPEFPLPLGEVAQGVLGDDDGAVDDEAEVEGAEAHQVGADAALDHAGHGHQHRHRDHERGDDGRADVAEQQEQDDDDEGGALGEVLGHRLDRGLDQKRAIEDGLDLDAGRERAPDLGHLARRRRLRPCGCSRRSASGRCR